ncbi:MAG TPA: carboxypeptidase regulatory-like domain-containing protein [Caldithrix sp.]|nr:carboxypeptidase regulatory-like domain-containing protein [Caldithrix sp.]
MGYETENYKRWQETLEAAQKIRSIIPSNVELHQFTFNNRVDTASSEKLFLSEGSTDFNTIISFIKHKNFNKAIIISDGNPTEGSYAVQNEWPFDTKIFTAGIGQISSGIDLAINNVTYQPVAYLDDENKIEIQIRVENLPNMSTLKLDYYINDKLIQQKKQNMYPGSYNQNINLTHINKQVGLNKLRIVAQTIEGEANILNNTYTFVQNVLDSKMKIGIFSGMPAYDSKFVSLLLQQVEDFEVLHYTEKRNGQFYNQTNLNAIEELDVFILIGFPGKYTLSNTMNRILNILRQKQPALLVFMNQYSDQQKLLQLRPWLPYEQLPAKIKAMDVIINHPLSSSINPLLYIYDEKERNQEFWSKAPPIRIEYAGGKLKDNVQTLLSGSGSRNEFPLILLSEQQNYRSLSFNGEGFWKWHFLLQDRKQISTAYQKFLVALLRWANDRTKLKPVTLVSEQNVVDLGESVQITGYIYDNSFQPVKDGELAVNAEWNKQTFSLEVKNDSTGSYLIDFMPPGEGKYTITAKGYREGIELGSDKLEIEVIPVEKEFIHINQNVNFLKKLAEMGNGFYVNASDIDSLRSVLIQQDAVTLRDRVIDIWYHPVLLTMIIVLITTEWIMRKRLGLV